MDGNFISSYGRSLNVRNEGEEFLLIPTVFLGTVKYPLGIGYNSLIVTAAGLIE